jgi:hypothetical protein
MARAKYQPRDTNPWPERVQEYRMKRQWYETYYPGTMIRDMPYRLPSWAKRGADWEKAHGRMVRFRQRKRRGLGG